MNTVPNDVTRRFLVVDDQPFMRKAVRRLHRSSSRLGGLCGGLGQPRSSGKGKELGARFCSDGLGHAAAESPSMPPGGFPKNLPDVQVLILTLHSLPDLVDAARSAGAKAFV